MNRLFRCCVPVLCAGLIPILSANAQGAPGGMGPGGTPPKPKNLKVLPQDTDLRKVMRAYSGDLGVECEFCHAPADPVTHRADRASDANPVKETARYMIQLTDDLNNKYLAQLPNRKGNDPITCGTCHRGEKQPTVFVPPPRQQGNRPPGAPAAAAPPAK
ncbi:MAG TPA: c-type cytochrome [Acidobacteriaceae bacterium]|jgi:hypothetical protein